MKTRSVLLFVLLLAVGTVQASSFDKKVKDDDDQGHIPYYDPPKYRGDVFVCAITKFDHDLPVPVDKNVVMGIQVNHLTPEKYAGKYLAIQITKKGRKRPEKTIRLEPEKEDLNKAYFKVLAEYAFHEEGEWAVACGIVDKEKKEFWTAVVIHITSKKQ